MQAVREERVVTGRCADRYYGILTAGKDTVWDYVSSPHIVLPELRSGQYELMILDLGASAGAEGIPVKVSFRILPAFWETPWFRIMLVLLIALFILLAFHTRERQVRRKYEERANVEVEMLNLRLEAIRSKINPHFTFNVLNSIQELILKDNRLSASEHIASFAHMNRMLLESSVRQLVPLYKELKLIEAYLGLEKLRLRDRLEYEIILEPGMNSQVLIPPCIALSFVENAIVHGISPLERKGRVRITAGMFNRQVKIIIEDNGVGRENSYRNLRKNNSHHISMGTQLSLHQIDILNQKRYNGQVEIIDLYDERQSPMGTKVEILYPI